MPSAWISLVAFLPALSVAKIASQISRRKCPTYQNMGCLLDIAEKICEPDEDPMALKQWGNEESVWLCCCPEPYKPCFEDEMDKVCLKGLQEHVTKANDKAALIAAVQKVRGALRETGGEECNVLAAEEPSSVCGFQAKPKLQRALAREDLFCEMLTWQLEELGDGNAAEFKKNNCPYKKKDRAGKKSDQRKGGKLDGSRPEL